MSILKHYPPVKRFALIGVVIIFFVLSVWLVTHFFNSANHSTIQQAMQPALVHQGDKFIIPQNSALRLHLVVQQVIVRSSPHKIVLPAAVEADPARTINILPPVAGRVVKLRVGLGDHVVKGQPLAVIDSAISRRRMPMTTRRATRCNTPSALWSAYAACSKAGAGALKDLEQAESDYAQAKAEFNRAEARLKEIGVPSQPKGGSRLLTLTAPMTGSVTALMTAPGAFVNDLTASLMTIANLDSVWVTANVPESDIAHIAKGQSVDVTFRSLPGPGLSRHCCIRKRCGGTGHAPQQGADSIRQSGRQVQTQYVCQCELQHTAEIRGVRAEFSLAHEQRQHHRVRRGCALDFRQAPGRSRLRRGRWRPHRPGAEAGRPHHCQRRGAAQ